MIEVYLLDFMDLVSDNVAISVRYTMKSAR